MATVPSFVIGGTPFAERLRQVGAEFELEVRQAADLAVQSAQREARLLRDEVEWLQRQLEDERHQSAVRLGLCAELKRQVEDVQDAYTQEGEAREYWQNECAAFEEKHSLLEAKLAALALTEAEARERGASDCAYYASVLAADDCGQKAANGRNSLGGVRCDGEGAGVESAVRAADARLSPGERCFPQHEGNPQVGAEEAGDTDVADADEANGLWEGLFNPSPAILAAAAGGDPAALEKQLSVLEDPARAGSGGGAHEDVGIGAGRQSLLRAHQPVLGPCRATAMASHQTRRSTRWLAGIAVGTATWLASRSFVHPSARSPLPRVLTAMHGFKEDFEAWRSSLTPEEQAMVQEQAQGEFNKAYRKSDAFKQDLPREKIDAFSKILGKFFDGEVEDYKKGVSQRVPDYDGLLKKAGDKKMDFSLKNRIIEIDRDADRRYNYATRKIRQREDEGGERFPQTSPMLERWAFANNDTESHESAKGIIEMMKKAKEMPNCPESAKPMIDEWISKGAPPMGEDFELLLPGVLVNQLSALQVFLDAGLKELAENESEAFMEKYIEEKIPEIASRVINQLTTKYIEGRDEVEAGAKAIKDFYRSQEKYKDQGLTKADVLKEIWATLPQYMDQAVPPLDEEMLAELAQEPAVEEGSFMHSWGTADTLYKSEAIDSFGQKYLLGIFETKEESIAAFNEWNAEYNDARKDMASEMAQWSKQEQARLDQEGGSEGIQRIRKMLEEARSTATASR